MELDSSLDKSKNGLAVFRKETRSVSPGKGVRPEMLSPSLARIGNMSSPALEGDGSRPTSRKSLTRRESVKMFADTALLGTHHKKFAHQGKLLQLKAQSRRESFLKEGGLKKVMAAPKIMKAFRIHAVSVSYLRKLHLLSFIGTRLVHKKYPADIFFNRTR